MHPIRGYLSPHAGHILRDFRLANPDAIEPLDRHDELLGECAVECGNAYDKLMASQELRRKALDLLDEFTREHPQQEYPGGAVPRDEFPKLVAEHVVNAIDPA